MALRGSFYGTTANDRIICVIEWNAVQNIAGNYSDVTATLKYSRTNTGYSTGGAWSGSITIDGTTVEGSASFNITYQSNTEAMTATVRVHHGDDGKKDIVISAAGAISGSTLSSTTISSTITLDQIARASGIAASSAFVEETTLIAVNRYSTSYMHSIAWGFNGTVYGYIKPDGTTTTQEVKMVETAISFPVPVSFYECIGINDKRGICTLACHTYCGDTLIGTTFCEFTVSTSEERCRPEVSGQVVDINETTIALTGDSRILVRYASVAECTITAVAKHYATIKKKWIQDTEVTADTITIKGVDTGSFKFQALDSRNYYDRPPTDPLIITRALVPYVPLTCKVSAQRTDPTSGKVELVIKGNYYDGSFGAVSNSLAVSCYINEEKPIAFTPAIADGEYTCSVVLEEMDYQKNHSIKVLVTDALSSVLNTVTVGKGIPVFDWGESDFRFNVPVSIPELVGNVLLQLHPVGSVYITTNETNPGALFGGTWKQIEDVFLLAAGKNWLAGDMGGAATHALTPAELPKHIHTGLFYTNSSGITKDVGLNAGASGYRLSYDTDKGKGVAELFTGYTGGDNAHNNMPPYLAVYVWERIA